MLVRKRIGQALGAYYAQPAHRVVGGALVEGSSSSPTTSNTAPSMNFKSLWGEWQYRRLVGKLYQQQDLHEKGRWLTSVELMRPYYSQCLANFVAAEARAYWQTPQCRANQAQPQKQSIDIVELGGGRATNASIILSHLQEAHPDVFAQIHSYTLMDASPSLLELQEQTLQATNHASLVKLELKNAMDMAEKKTPFLPRSDRPTIVLACELLDNLPHDKIRVKAGGRAVEQAEIRGGGKDDEEEEVFVPLMDPLLTKVLALTKSSYTRHALAAWIPTVACGLLHQLAKQRPNASFVLADFDWLPPPDLETTALESRKSLWAPGEPIITDMVGNDHACYLQAPPHCDILFPTDFEKLAHFVQASWNLPTLSSNNHYSKNTSKIATTSDDDKTTSQQRKIVQVSKQSDFLQHYGPEQVEQTKSWLTGFTPLLHDFANCSVLTVSHQYSEDDNVEEVGVDDNEKKQRILNKNTNRNSRGRPVKRPKQ